MIVLAIDPGTRESGWAILADDDEVLLSGKWANEQLLDTLIFPTWSDGYDPIKVELVVIESMNGAHGGMPFGVEKIEAVRWAGRFEQAAAHWHHERQADHPPYHVVRQSREETKRVLIGAISIRGTKADTVVRAWLIDHFAAVAGDPLGGKAAAVGTKAAPGPLFGAKADIWSAIALAVARHRGALDITAERARTAEEKAARAAR